MEEFKSSRDNSMSVQRLTIILYTIGPVLIVPPNDLLTNNQCALALGVSPPSPHSPWAAPPPLFLSVGVLGV